MYGYVSCKFLVPEIRSGHQISWNWRWRWLWAVTWLLGTNPRSSARATSAFTSRASLQPCAPLLFFSELVVYELPLQTKERFWGARGREQYCRAECTAHAEDPGVVLCTHISAEEQCTAHAEDPGVVLCTHISRFTTAPGDSTPLVFINTCMGVHSLPTNTYTYLELTHICFGDKVSLCSPGHCRILEDQADLTEIHVPLPLQCLEW